MISVVIPVFNEIGNLETLYQELVAALEPKFPSFELIFVNDGSTDGTEKFLNDLGRADKRVAIIHSNKNLGKAACLQQGFAKARGDRVANIDGDLQMAPSDLPEIFSILAERADVVTGRRVNRADPFLVRTGSYIFNVILRAITGLPIEDFFSGLKGYRKEVIGSLGFSSHDYRFAPLVAYRSGFRIIEVPVTHRARFRGRSKYSSLGRLKLAIGDLLRICSLSLSKEKT